MKRPLKVSENEMPDFRSSREREDEERRRRHDEAVDPWGYDEPVDEEPPRDYDG